jgi:hypothetical protein
MRHVRAEIVVRERCPGRFVERIFAHVEWRDPVNTELGRKRVDFGGVIEIRRRVAQLPVEIIPTDRQIDTTIGCYERIVMDVIRNGGGNRLGDQLGNRGGGWN